VSLDSYPDFIYRFHHGRVTCSRLVEGLKCQPENFVRTAVRAFTGQDEPGGILPFVQDAGNCYRLRFSRNRNKIRLARPDVHVVRWFPYRVFTIINIGVLSFKQPERKGLRGLTAMPKKKHRKERAKIMTLVYNQQMLTDKLIDVIAMQQGRQSAQHQSPDAAENEPAQSIQEPLTVHNRTEPIRTEFQQYQ
jgi:hypothetical protein